MEKSLEGRLRNFARRKNGTLGYCYFPLADSMALSSAVLTAESPILGPKHRPISEMGD